MRETENRGWREEKPAGREIPTRETSEKQRLTRRETGGERQVKETSKKKEAEKKRDVKKRPIRRETSENRLTKRETVGERDRLRGRPAS